MGNGRAVSGVDRLPWLADEGEAPRARRPLDYLPWLLLLFLGVAALSYWLGANSERLRSAFGPEQSPASGAEVVVPEVSPAIPDLAATVVEPVPEPAMPAISEVPTVSPPASVLAPATPRTSSGAGRAKAPPKPKARPKSKTAPKRSAMTPWPVRVVEGSSGRLVRVGAFSSRIQAKRGWRALMRVNPALQRLPALVVPARSARDGKTYYRLQMGTTSQAHSVVLCQRMRMIGQSCVVVAPAVEEAP